MFYVSVGLMINGEFVRFYKQNKKESHLLYQGRMQGKDPMNRKEVKA